MMFALKVLPAAKVIASRLKDAEYALAEPVAFDCGVESNGAAATPRAFAESEEAVMASEIVVSLANPLVVTVNLNVLLSWDQFTEPAVTAKDAVASDSPASGVSTVTVVPRTDHGAKVTLIAVPDGSPLS
jgi:hypothetical protein